MDARRAPQRIVSAHLSDQISQFAIDLWPAHRAPRSPTPPSPIPCPVPADYSLRLDDQDGVRERRKQPIQPNDQSAVDAQQRDLRRLLPTQHVELVPQ